MLILPLIPQPLFKEFGVATETQLKHVHCLGCPFCVRFLLTQVHEVEPNTPTLQSLLRKGLLCLQELSAFPPSLGALWYHH